MSVVLTRYLYPKECVMSSLVWAILDPNANGICPVAFGDDTGEPTPSARTVSDAKSEEALFWAYELYYSGFKQDVFDLLISIHIIFYHEKYPQQTDILYPLLEKWHLQEKAQNKKFRHHDTILGSVLMNIMYYQTPSVDQDGRSCTGTVGSLTSGSPGLLLDPPFIEDDGGLVVLSGSPKALCTGRAPLAEYTDIQGGYTKHLYTCSLSQLMRKRAGVNYIETVYEKRDGSDSNHPIEFTLHELRPYQTIYTKPPSVILRDACKYPIRNLVCDVRDHNKYVTEEGERSDVYEMALRYLKNHPYTMNIQEIQDKWLYYASYSPIWAKRIADNHGEIDHDTQSVLFDNDDDEEQFYQEFQYEPDEQSIAVQNSIGINVSYTTMSWLDFYHKYGKDNAIRTVKIRIHV